MNALARAMRCSRILLLLLLAALLSSHGEPSADSAEVDTTSAYMIRRLGSLNFVTSSNETNRIVYSSDGRYLATVGFATFGDAHARIDIWDRVSGENVTPLPLRALQTTGVCWAPEGYRFVTAHHEDDFSDSPNGLNLWTVGSNEQKSLGDPKNGSYCVVWSPAGDRIAACDPKSEQIWLLNSEGRIVQTIPFSGGKRILPPSHILEFTPDGTELAVVTSRGIGIYDVKSCEVSREIPLEKTERVYAIRLLSNSKALVIGTDRGIQLHRLEEPKSDVRTLGDKAVTEIAVSRDQTWLAASSAGDLEVWNLKTGMKCHSIDESQFWGVAFAPDNSELALGTKRTSFLQTGTWKPVRNEDEHHKDLLVGLVTGTTIWTGESGPTLREWDYENGAALRSIRRTIGKTIALANIDNKYLAVAGLTPEIELRDIKTGTLADTLPDFSAGPNALTYSAKYRRLLFSGDDGCIRAWNLDSKKIDYEIRPVKSAEPFVWSKLVASPDGETFVSSDLITMEIRSYAVQTGEQLWNLTVGDAQVLLSPVAFTSDSSRVASIVSNPRNESEDLKYSVRLVDAKTSVEKTRLNCRAYMIVAIAISPDDKHAAISTYSQNSDSHIEIWSLETNQLVARLKGEGSFVKSLNFSPDGTKLITLSQNTTGIVWDVQAAIRQRAGLRRI